jgi:hypothetical protein
MPKNSQSDLRIPIVVHDEVGDDVIVAKAMLNMASGEIEQVRYEDYDEGIQGFPWENEDYDFSCGLLSNNGKDVEFTVTVNRTTGNYSVSANELAEIKIRAAALFSGYSNAELSHQPNPKGIGALGESMGIQAAKKRS